MVPPPIYYYEVPGGGKSRHIKDVMFPEKLRAAPAAGQVPAATQPKRMAHKTAAGFTLAGIQKPRQRDCSASFFEETRLSGLKPAILAVAGRTPHGAGRFQTSLHRGRGGFSLQEVQASHFQ
jgi:hypothetical protein